MTTGENGELYHQYSQTPQGEYQELPEGEEEEVPLVDEEDGDYEPRKLAKGNKRINTGSGTSTPNNSGAGPGGRKGKRQKVNSNVGGGGGNAKGKKNAAVDQFMEYEGEGVGGGSEYGSIESGQDQLAGGGESEAIGAGQVLEQGAAADEAEPLYVNAKQYHRILKRRSARARLEEMGRLSRERKVSFSPFS